MTAIDDITGTVIEEAIALHRGLGPGLFESDYETILAAQLEARGLKVVRQCPVPLEYNGHQFDLAFRVDLWVNDQLVVEIKAVDQLSKAHAKQVLTYIRLLEQPVGLLLNFSGETMKEGIRRLVNNHAR